MEIFAKYEMARELINKKYRAIIHQPHFFSSSTTGMFLKVFTNEKRGGLRVISFDRPPQCCGSGMFIPDPGSDFFPSRIPDPNCLHPGSRILIKEFKYFNPPKSKKMVSKL